MNIKESIKIKNLELKNRIVMPPMASENTEDGLVRPGHYKYYTDRTDGGHIGLVITEHMYAHVQGKASRGQLSIAEDDCIDGLQGLTAAIKRSGAAVFAQINHAGSGTSQEITGMEIVGPSPVTNFSKARAGGVPREMSLEEIKAIPAMFAAAALRAKRAGYDGVEIHSAHGYLLNQFYSPLLNKRSDEYGAENLEKRLRLHLETIKAVREAVGEDYPVALRLGGSDYMEGGSTIEDCAEACGLFEKAGLDLIDLSGGLCNYSPVDAEGKPRSGVLFEDMSRAVKAAVSIPVLVTGGIVDGETAGRLIEEGACDLVGIGRALLKDANWAEHQVYGI